MTAGSERELFAKAVRRLIPFLFLLYIVAYIDRINVGFAKLQLREAIGVDPAAAGTVFGFGAGLFFLGYFLFEVPSNLILKRIGARIWIARIMIVWGAVSSAMMFVHSATAFYAMRFLLGAAEAGFFPGILYYLTHWFPARERARTIALFLTAGTLAGVIGSPVSGALLGLDGYGGLSGWQWLFLIEGLPAVVLGVVVLFVLPERPSDARWLTPDERVRLEAIVQADREASGVLDRQHLRHAFTDSRVWLMCGLYFLLNVGGYGFEMWCPGIVKSFSGRSAWVVGLINMVPYLAATVAMVLAGHHSDRTGERRWHVAVAAFVAAAGFVASARLTGHPVAALAALTVAFAGLKCIMGPFWSLGTSFLGGTAAAGGIALINSVGNLGGFVGPMIVGKAVDATGGYGVALGILGGALLTLGLLALALRPQIRRAG